MKGTPRQATQQTTCGRVTSDEYRHFAQEEKAAVQFKEHIHRILRAPPRSPHMRPKVYRMVRASRQGGRRRDAATEPHPAAAAAAVRAAAAVTHAERLHHAGEVRVHRRGLPPRDGRRVGAGGRHVERRAVGGAGALAAAVQGRVGRPRGVAGRARPGVRLGHHLRQRHRGALGARVEGRGSST